MKNRGLDRFSPVHLDVRQNKITWLWYPLVKEEERQERRCISIRMCC